jgi:uncharacterized protein YjbJ (UPF0337 family)
VTRLTFGDRCDGVLLEDDTRKKEIHMADGKVDDAKGRIKEAAGDLTNDQSLKNEGKVDRATGTLKDRLGEAADKVKNIVNPKD